MTTPPPTIRDPEVQTLIRLFEDERRTRQPPDVRDGIWSGSPFEWLVSWPKPRTVGAIFEAVVHQWCEGMGLEVLRAGDRDADRVIAGKRFEIKGSTLWGGTYTFQQLRDQEYDAVICLGVSPNNAHCWVIPKDDVLARWRGGEIGPQHGGQRGRDTAWLWVDPAKPGWLRNHGGSLSEAKQALLESVRSQRS